MSRKVTEVTTDPEILSGIPVFKGTRVPFQNLVDCLKAGESIDEFLDAYPSVRREQVMKVMDQVQDLLVEAA